jgi:hypothetical protein
MRNALILAFEPPTATQDSDFRVDGQFAIGLVNGLSNALRAAGFTAHDHEVVEDTIEMDVAKGSDRYLLVLHWAPLQLDGRVSDFWVCQLTWKSRKGPPFFKRQSPMFLLEIKGALADYVSVVLSSTYRWMSENEFRAVY